MSDLVSNLVFPVFDRTIHSHGLTVRQWYVGQMLPGVLANSHGLGDMSEETRKELYKELTTLLFELADTLIEYGDNNG